MESQSSCRPPIIPRMSKILLFSAAHQNNNERQGAEQTDEGSDSQSGRTKPESYPMFAGRHLNCLKRFAPALNRNGVSIDSGAPAWVELLSELKPASGVRTNDELTRFRIPPSTA